MYFIRILDVKLMNKVSNLACLMLTVAETAFDFHKIPSLNSLQMYLKILLLRIFNEINN